MLCVRITLIQAHTGVILFFRYNYIGKYKKRRYGLARHVKIDFCIFGDCTGEYGENFTGKTGKNFTVNFLDKKLFARKKKKKTS